YRVEAAMTNAEQGCLLTKERAAAEESSPGGDSVLRGGERAVVASTARCQQELDGRGGLGSGKSPAHRGLLRSKDETKARGTVGRRREDGTQHRAGDAQSRARCSV